MVNRDLVSAKLEALAQRVARVRVHRKADAVELDSDDDALDLVSFNLMLCVQICADVASHIIADEGWPAASTLAAAFTRLHEHDVVAAETSRRLKLAVGLRNVVAHGYTHVDPAMVHAASHQGLDDLEAFAREVAAWLTQVSDDASSGSGS